MELNIINMYPDILNMYGDIGNFTCIKQRANWRGIDVNVKEFTVDTDLTFDAEETDIILIGGGSDNSQTIVSEHLLGQRSELANYIENNGVLLAICASYQMFGDTYVDVEGNKIPSLEIFDIETHSEANRLIGNVILENNLNLKTDTLVGFENHGGRTYHDYDPLGYVKLGYGNNGEDKKEGMVYKNFIASYLHGPFLPKNPHIADLMIFNALKDKYDLNCIDDLTSLDDSIELAAHNAMVSKLLNNEM